MTPRPLPRQPFSQFGEDSPSDFTEPSPTGSSLGPVLGEHGLYHQVMYPGFVEEMPRQRPSRIRMPISRLPRQRLAGFALGYGINDLHGNNDARGERPWLRTGRSLT